jgi:cytidine deaminase
MSTSAAKLAELKRRARDVSRHAYVPYSRFAVGAAVLTDSGEIFAGANVENASYGLSICAERNAIFQAVAHGARRIAALALYTPTAAPTPPCGACRQVLAEFGASAMIVCSSETGRSRRYRLAALLPAAFGPANLTQGDL